MFYTFGKDTIYENIIINIINTNNISFSDVDLEGEISQLSPYYLEFLKEYNSDVEGLLEGRKVESNSRLCEFIKQSFSRSSINDFEQDKMIGNSLTSERLELGHKKIKESISKMQNIDVDLFSVFDFIIKKIVSTESNKNNLGMSAKGGSSQTSIGFIWLTNPDLTSSDDVLEMLVHELTHHALFIDELVYKHFDYSTINCDSTYCDSAILKVKRPMDKVLHSILVATEIILFRVNNKFEFISNIHPKTVEMLETTLLSIESVYDNPNVKSTMQERGFNIIDRCKKELINVKGGVNETYCR